MAVLGLHHVCIWVTNLERSIAFYRDAFGLELAARLTFGAENIAFLALGAARLELIEANPRTRATGVIDHLALEVDHLEPLLERLHELGTPFVDAAPIGVPELNARILFCLGPDAERIELFEYSSP